MNTAISIKKDIKILLDSMGFIFLNDPEVREEDGRFFIDIFVDEPRRLIGERGDILQALQHVIRLLPANRHDQDIKLDIDINGYKQKRAELLRDMAHRARREASTGSGVVELEPMSAFDRRIIHTTLDAYNNIKTESTGEGRDRRVIIKRV